MHLWLCMMADSWKVLVLMLLLIKILVCILGRNCLNYNTSAEVVFFFVPVLALHQVPVKQTVNRPGNTVIPVKFITYWLHYILTADWKSHYKAVLIYITKIGFLTWNANYDAPMIRIKLHPWYKTNANSYIFKCPSFLNVRSFEFKALTLTPHMLRTVVRILAHHMTNSLTAV